MFHVIILEVYQYVVYTGCLVPHTYIPQQQISYFSIFVFLFFVLFY